MKHIFICYARADGAEFAKRLHDDLEENGITTWLDVVDIPAGADWDSEIDKGLSNAYALAFVMTPASVLSTQAKSEWNSALNRNVPLLPLLYKSCDIPRVLNVFNYLDFRSDYEEAFANLYDRINRVEQDHLDYLTRTLEAYRVAQKEADNPRRFDSRIESLTSTIEMWESRKEDQYERIASGLDAERSLFRDKVLPRKQARTVNIAGKKPIEVTELFKNRHHQRARISELIAENNVRLISIIARGGMGKTALASKILEDLANGIWQHTSDDVPVDVAGIVYLSTRTDGVSVERIFLDTAKVMSEAQAKALNAVWSSSRLSLEEKIDQLIDALNDELYIILLDNMEDLQDNEGQLTNWDLQVFFDRALRRLHKSRILLTSRLPLALARDIRVFDNHVNILDGLPVEDGIQLLRELDPNGYHGTRDASTDSLSDLVKLGHGVPRALEVMIGILANDPFMSIDELHSEFMYHEDTVKELIAQNFLRLDESSQHVLEALAVFRRPVTMVAIDFLLEPFFPGIDVPSIIKNLANTHVVGIDRATKTITLHPIDRDYSYSQIPFEAAIVREGVRPYTVQEAESRAADYYFKLHEQGDWKGETVHWSHLDHVATYLNEFDHRIRAQECDKAALILGRICSFLAHEGHPLKLKEMCSLVDGKVVSAEAQAAFYEARAHTFMIFGPLDRAIKDFQLAIEKTHESGNLEPLRLIVNSLAETYRYQGDTENAIKYLKQALVLNQEVGDTYRQVMALMRLTLVYTNVWKLGDALQYGEEALAVAHRTGKASEIGQAHNGLAIAYQSSGQYRKAIEHAHLAIEAYNKSFADGVGSHKVGTMFMKNLLGMANLALRNFDAADEWFAQAKTEAEKYDNPRVLGFIMFSKACRHRIEKDDLKAYEAAKASTRIFRDVRVEYVTAAEKLEEACRARLDRDVVTEIESLLITAREALKSPDLYLPVYFAEEAKALALSNNLSDYIERSETLLSELAEKMQA